jgi:hypothetical protein
MTLEILKNICNFEEPHTTLAAEFSMLCTHESRVVMQMTQDHHRKLGTVVVKDLTWTAEVKLLA